MLFIVPGWTNYKVDKPYGFLVFTPFLHINNQGWHRNHCNANESVIHREENNYYLLWSQNSEKFESNTEVLPYVYRMTGPTKIFTLIVLIPTNHCSIKSLQSMMTRSTYNTGCSHQKFQKKHCSNHTIYCNEMNSRATQS